MSDSTQDPFEPRRLLTDAQALAEAGRCQGCVDGACTRHCPLDVDVGAFIRRIRTDNAAGAFRVLRSHNPMPETTALICPLEQICQRHCSNAQVSEAVNIGLLQRYVAHHGRRVRPPRQHVERARRCKVAVVGGGPAGLACVDRLVERGIGVEVFEASGEPGGALVRWIPPHRLPRDVVAREVADILGTDVPVHTGQALGRDFSLDDLLARGFEAVFLATGLPSSVDGSLPGSNGPQVVQALEYLEQHALGGAPVAGPNVVVVGGGNTAVDAAVCAKLAGARDVYLVYRRSFGQMPAWREDRQRAVDAGVHVLILVRPVECVRHQDGSLAGVRCVRTELADPVGEQRREPVDLPGTEFVLPANLVILALGQHLGARLQAALAGMRFNPDGTLWTDPETRATSRPNVYAGGDLANTDHTVVHALAVFVQPTPSPSRCAQRPARAEPLPGRVHRP